VISHRTHSRLDSDCGLTLVEILIALAVIGVVLAAVSIVVPLSTYGVEEGRQLSTAIFLAEQMIERARGAAWTEGVDCLGVSVGDVAPIPSSATCHGLTSTQFPDEMAGIEGSPRYRRSVRVASCATTACAGTTTTGLRLVIVSVAYVPLTGTGVSSRPNTVRLEWLVAQK
jgi:prepilin-type N-terminal cleavage/methylation domain-containing protein